MRQNSELFKMLLEKYSMRLGVEDIANILGVSQNSIRANRRANKLPFKTYQENTRFYADLRDVVAYLDKSRKEAS